MKRVLIIIESSLTRDFLQEKLDAFGLEVTTAKNGFEGQNKIRSDEPHLIIMDYTLSRVSAVEIMKEKLENPNAKDIPVILLIDKLSKEKIMELTRFGVKRFLAKPIKMDTLVQGLSELLDLPISIDNTPCIIDAHFNDGIIFIDVARGLNTEKIDLLKLKIKELVRIYEIDIPKVLIIMTDIRLEVDDYQKFYDFLSAILNTSRTPAKGIKILTTAQSVKDSLSSNPDYAKIEVVSEMTEAMDSVLGIKVSDFIDEGLSIVKDDFLRAKETHGAEQTIDLRFHGEKTIEPEEKTVMAVVDDDPVIRELVSVTFSSPFYTVHQYENGRSFMNEVEENLPDLIFLDLRMPEMDGFTVLQKMREKNIDRPVIILSAMTQRETVVKARNYGVKSYLSKPLKTDAIKKKTEEVLKLNF